MPSGNAVAMWNLLRLARVTVRTELEERAEKLARVFSAQVLTGPAAFTGLMLALDFVIGPTHEIVIAGAPEAEDTRAMLRALGETYLPGKVVLLRSTSEAAPQICCVPPICPGSMARPRLTSARTSTVSCPPPTWMPCWNRSDSDGYSTSGASRDINRSSSSPKNVSGEAQSTASKRQPRKRPQLSQAAGFQA